MRKFKEFKTFERWAKNGLPVWYWIIVDNVSLVIATTVVAFIFSLFALGMIPIFGKIWAQNETVMKSWCEEVLKP